VIKLKKLLKEIESGPYEYGCVMVYLDVNKEDWDNLEGMINKEDLYLYKDGIICGDFNLTCNRFMEKKFLSFLGFL
jgi:hypothetical protein